MCHSSKCQPRNGDPRSNLAAKNKTFCLCAQHMTYSLALAVVVQPRIHGENRIAKTDWVEELSRSLVERLNLRGHRKESFPRHKRICSQQNPKSDRRTGGMLLLIKPNSIIGKLGSWSRTQSFYPASWTIEFKLPISWSLPRSAYLWTVYWRPHILSWLINALWLILT